MLHTTAWRICVPARVRQHIERVCLDTKSWIREHIRLQEENKAESSPTSDAIYRCRRTKFGYCVRMAAAECLRGSSGASTSASTRPDMTFRRSRSFWAPLLYRRCCCKAVQQELSVCVNKTCKGQGSVPVAQLAEDLNLHELRVVRTGCQGKCGNGPNVRLEPGNLQFSHIATPTKLAQLLKEVCQLEVSPQLLKATELRLAGVAEARVGNLQGAIECWTQALAAEPSQGAHLILSNRSAAYRSLGQYEEAARDAEQAVACAPPGFSTGYIRQVEAYSALEDYQAAMLALEQAAKVDRDFRLGKDFKTAKAQLQPLLKQSKPRLVSR